MRLTDTLKVEKEEPLGGLLEVGLDSLEIEAGDLSRRSRALVEVSSLEVGEVLPRPGLGGVVLDVVVELGPSVGRLRVRHYQRSVDRLRHLAVVPL